MRLFVLAGLALSLAACQTAPQTAPSVGLTRNTRAVVAFGCQSGLVFTAAFLVSPDAVELTFADGAKLTLPHVVAASGARYATATHEFWNKGDEATYTIGRAAPAICRVAK